MVVIQELLPATHFIASFLILFKQCGLLYLPVIRRAQVKVGLINLCKGLFSLNARIYYKLKSGT
jgi:hypothetical protein